MGNFSKIGAVIASVFLPTWFRLFPSVKSISKRQDGLIICMTSFPARIDYVWLVVECLLRQTIQAEDIVLYLSKKQFPTKDKLPSQLLNMELNHKVTIKMENEDYRSHKKYWYALRDFPNKTIITVDDDIIYDSKLIEQLIVFQKNIRCVFLAVLFQQYAMIMALNTMFCLIPNGVGELIKAQLV